ncbi:MAG: hypothetical protein J0L56_03180 [Chitinophagales bacterium]|nr:hypothetical protein [Chitinophagales bacterium]
MKRLCFVMVAGELFFTFFLDKILRLRSVLRSFAGPPTYVVTGSGNIVCIRIVSSKVEDAKAWFAKTPIALCSAWMSLQHLVVSGGTEQCAGNAWQFEVYG